jgi:hypothetical protein
MNEKADSEDPAARHRRLMSEDPGSLDEFEKEAREGFAQLNDPEAAIDLQRETDVRVLRAIRSHSQPRTYWLAAAALVGVIGFVVWLFDRAVPEPKTLSLDTSERQERVAPLAPSTTISEAVTPPPHVKSQPVPVSKKKFTEPKPSEERIASDHENERADVNKNDLAFAQSQEMTISPQTAASGAAPVMAAAPAPRRAEKAALSHEAATEEATIAASHPAGKDSLCAKVLAQLRPLVTSFDAVLYIGDRGTVERVRLLRTYQFTAEQQRAIENKLLQLDGFRLSGPAGAGLAEYRLGCAPR